MDIRYGICGLFEEKIFLGGCLQPNTKYNIHAVSVSKIISKTILLSSILKLTVSVDLLISMSFAHFLSFTVCNLGMGK